MCKLFFVTRKHIYIYLWLYDVNIFHLKKNFCFVWKPDSPLGHLFSTYQVTIMQSCDQCSSFIWGMEKAFMCSCKYPPSFFIKLCEWTRIQTAVLNAVFSVSACKMVCHKKCLSKITVNCTGHCYKKVSTAVILLYVLLLHHIKTDIFAIYTTSLTW